MNSNIEGLRNVYSYYQNYNTNYTDWFTLSQSVEVVDLCTINAFWSFTCPSYTPSLNCSPGEVQVLDTDSIDHNEVYYQNVTLNQTDEFRLTFDWVS